MKVRNQPTRLDFRVGPETPLGTALRRFWVPACLSSEVAEPDCDPYRVRLLGQSFVAFRDTQGRVGLLDEACPHRRASLVFGRNENGGLRCLWHQWKIDVDGNLLETPNHDNCTFRQHVKARAYPVRESGGLVWTYIGPAEHEPPFPEFSWASEAAENQIVVPVDLDCSFIHPLEGLVDSAHVSLLHVDAINALRETAGADKAALTASTMPKLDVRATDFGFHYGALRAVEHEGQSMTQVRVTAFAAPYVVFIANGNIHLSVPQDDTHTRFYNVVSQRELRSDRPLAEMLVTLGVDPQQLEDGGIASTMPGLGPLGQRNRFSQDRVAMRANTTFTGVQGLTVEDAVMTVSAGYLAEENSPENLVPADLAISRLHRWMKEISTRVANGDVISEVAPETETRRISAISALLVDGQD
ncbi:Rieske 2Fe-2S domain-containing protein [Sphingomonas sp. GB1N7]